MRCRFGSHTGITVDVYGRIDGGTGAEWEAMLPQGGFQSAKAVQYIWLAPLDHLDHTLI